MDISVYNIDALVHPLELRGRLSKALRLCNMPAHCTPLLSHFQLSMSGPLDARRTRTAALLLPTHEIGSLFMGQYGGTNPRLAINLGPSGTRLAFKVKPQNRRFRQTMPSPIPQVDSSLVRISTVQFGWECRDNAFSVEYEKTGVAPSHLIFDEDRRQFRLHLIQKKDHQVLSIVIRASHIVWASTDSSGPAIFFSLSSVPTYETTPHIPVLKGKDSRTQLSSLDEQHEQYAAYTSTAIRVLCPGLNHLVTVKKIFQEAHVHVVKYAYPVVRRNIFSADVRSQYNAWIATEPFEISFQVDAIARAGLMDLQELLRLKPHLKKMQMTMGTSYVASFVRYLAEEASDTSWYKGSTSKEPVDHLIKLFLECKKSFKPSVMLPFSDAEVFACYHLTITPSRFILTGPFPEKNNRIMRKYADHTSNFLRVEFTDEEGFQYKMDRAVNSLAFVRKRFGYFLSEGVNLVGRHFNMLQWSSSGLKQHSVWFVRSFQMSGKTVAADSILSGIGNFHNTPYDPRLVYCPARLGARRALAFTTTDAAVEVEAEEIVVEPDTEDARGKRSFTDGAGLISEALIAEVWRELQDKSRRYRRIHKVPDAIQLRIQGIKGTATVSRHLKGRVLVVRPSMIKFEAPHSRTVEVAAAFTKAGPFRLNRPLIMLLEGLQIKGGFEVLKGLQDAVIQGTIDATRSLSTAARLLEPHGLGTGFKVSSVFASLAKLGVEDIPDPFFHRVLRAATYHILRDLKYHARIPVPGGYTLVGVADPYNCLEEKEVFACVTTSSNAEPVFLEGEMMLSRSPGVHPGDVQVVRAIGRPPEGSPLDLHPIRNALVFPTKGARPIASKLGGGDLDGDVFVITGLEGLLPQRKCFPADYDSATRKELPHPSTQKDMADFVTEFICSDNIGIIATRWLEMADKSPRGIFDARCLRLAYMHSLATDYPKTGVPVPLAHLPESDIEDGRPDWSAPEAGSSGKFYKSTRYLGRLFWEVHLPEPPSPPRSNQPYKGVVSLQEVTDFFRNDSVALMDPLDKAVHDHVSAYIQAAPLRNNQRISYVRGLFMEYLPRLRTICLSYNLHQKRSAMLSEEEVVVGTIVAQTSQTALRKERMSQVREQVSLLTEHVSSRLNADAESPHEVLKRAWVAYRMTALRPESFGSDSFRLLALHEIFDAVKEIDAMESQDDTESDSA